MYDVIKVINQYMISDSIYPTPSLSMPPIPYSCLSPLPLPTPYHLISITSCNIRAPVLILL